MLTLAPAGTIQGVAGSATAITCAIFGCETAAGVDTYKVLYQGQLASSVGVLYTATAVTAVIKTITLVNATASAVTGIILYVNGSTAGYQITGPFTIAANGTAVFNGTGWEFYDGNGRQLQTSTPSTGVATILNVKDYGATGDGTTDDTNALKAAIAAAAAAGVSGRGVSLWFPSGIYMITSVLAITQNNISLLGAGQGSTVILPNASTFLTGDVIQFGNGTGHSAIEFRGIQVFCAAARTTGAGININFANDVKIDDFAFNNMFTAIKIQGGSIKVSISNGTINNCLATTGIGIQVLNGLAGDTYIGPNVVWTNSGTKPLAGISLEQTGHCSIFRCNITSAKYGIQIVPAAVDCTYLFIDHTLCDSGDTAGLYIAPTASASSRVRSLIAVNSWFSGCVANPGYGIWINGGAGSIIDDIKFIGCRILNNYTHGVYWQGPATATNLKWLSCVVAGNSIGSSNAADGFNIVAAASGFDLVDCRIGQAGTAGNTQRYAINIASGASNNFTIANCDVSLNNTPPYINNLSTGYGWNCTNNYPGPNFQCSLGKPLTAPVATVSTTDTLIYALAVPANGVQIGSTFRCTMRGVMTGAGLMTFKVMINTSAAVGGVTAWASVASVAQVSTHWCGMEADVTIRSIGAPGSAQGAGKGYASALVLEQLVGAAATVAVTTTALFYIIITAASATVAASFSAQTATIEMV